MVLFVDSGFAGKLNSAKTVIKKDPPLTQGLLYPFESESRDVRSLDGMWRFLKGDYNDSTNGLEEKWYATNLDKAS